MEESSAAHMETDVSSTTDDVPEAPEVSASRPSVETVVVVEKIKEEGESSPGKEKNSPLQPAEAKSASEIAKPASELAKPVDRPPLKKIIIKSPNNKDYQIVKIISAISDESKKPTSSSLTPQPSNSNVVDSSSKLESMSCPNKSAEVSQTNTTSEKGVSMNKIIIKSPVKIQAQDSKIQSPSKEIPEKSSPKKDGHEKEILNEVSLIKEMTKKGTPVKDTSSNISPAKESTSNDSPVKDFFPKVILSKEITAKPVQPIETDNKPSTKASLDEIITNNKQTGKTNESVPTHSQNPKTDSLDNKPDDSPSKSNITSMDIDKETSNDSQMETNSDTSEKEHNKSISRELKSLINSAKESKIISECTQLTSKTRKSRAPLDSASTSLNMSIDAEKIQGGRRNSDNSQKSGCSEKSEKGLKRSMRSQNPEFVNKVKKFLNSVSDRNQKEGEESEDEEQEDPKDKGNETEAEPSVPKKKKTDDVSDKPDKLHTDLYCWRCHWAVEPAASEKTHSPVHCTVCPRSFHFKCLSVSERTKVTTEKSWVCPECSMILSAEGSETRSPAMKKISLGMLCDLLKHALDRMMEINGVEPFMHPVDRTVFPDYDKYVVHPMDLTQMKNNITSGQYGSTEAFLADAQWILHNSIIFNTLQSKLTGGARALVRSCRAEMGEIEACPECYAAAHARRPTWFTDVCTTPHVLLWAKLKGFPYWPAKGMSINSSGLVDVRFFGAHDRAWVPARDCFLYSEKDPNNFRTKRQDILESMQEAEHHIRNISRKYGKFVYPPFRTQFDPSKLEEQLKMMIPSFEGEIKTPLKDKSNSSPSLGKDKSKSHAKSTKATAVDGEASENEETSSTKSRKMADGKEIAGEEDFAVEKEKEMEVDSSQNKDNDAITTRKRRRSALEEAVITIIDSSSSRAKKRRTESAEITSETKSSEPVATPSTSKSVDEKKEGEKAKPDEKNKTDQKAKDNEPSSSTTSPADKKRTPIRLISIAKVLKTVKVNATVAEKTPPQKTEHKTEKLEKPLQKSKPKTDKSDSTENVIPLNDKVKDHKRRNSKNKSTNNSSTPKTDKKTDKTADASVNKEKTTQDTANKSVAEKVADKSVTGIPRSKDRLQFDDDISLATIARESKTPNTTNVSLPTISSIRSLSATAQNTTTTTTKTTSTPKTTQVTVEASSNSSIFTPTSTDDVKTMKDAVSKLQKLRNEEPTPVGRVGVRAFARMTSPPKETPKDVEVEIKAEPIDFDDSDRQVEKMDLMNAFQLRPVVRPPQPTNLREVRINKTVVSTPSTANVPIAAKNSNNNNSKARAKKTFPQPKKDDGRSELNSKNSMVYIPIQPPMTQAPARLPRPLGPATLRAPGPSIVTTATASNVLSTVTSLIPVSLSTLTKPVVSATTTSQAQGMPPTQTVPTVGQVPTTVHTVPLITSVNGQWTFSLQPVMSVGGVDGAPSPPMMNGLAERNNLLPLQAPPAPTLVSTSAAAPILVPAAAAPPVLVPTTTSQTSNRSDSNPPREVAETVLPPVPTLVPIASPRLLPILVHTSSSHTPQMEATEMRLGKPPRLQQRPPLVNPLDASAPLGSVPPPSTAGALTAKLNQNSVKMTDFFRTLLEDCIEKLDDPLAQASALKLQLEQVQWKHQQLVEEIKHNHELTLAEMRSSFEKERQRVINETRRAAQAELDAAVKLAKSKQWCANCSQEAQFYCCWNTSYCDYPCQRAHWTQHYAVCTQSRQDGSSNDSGNPPEDRLQPAPENLPKTTAAPSLTVGGKLAPSRVYTQDNSPKTSIIMSMVEDPSGNQTLKCVGTYKSPAAPAQIAPLIINKQIMNSEESKKVVTSGGYLIVGAGSGTPPAPSLVNARRTHTIQYFT